jgi:ketosteroid isomerase-like protein
MTPSFDPGSAAAAPLEADQQAAWAVVQQMYAAYTDGDRAGIDACLDPCATVWDSATDQLLHGKADLDQVRDARPTPGSGPVEAGLSTSEPVVDVHGPLALVRYWLRVDFADEALSGRPLTPELVRNTAVLRRGDDGRWLIVHLHEEVRQHGGAPVGD